MNWAVFVPWILTLFTALIGILQFTAQQRQANRLPFLQRQIDVCFQAAETAGRLASETDPGEWEKARLTFWRLYWGQLTIVEDRDVEGAMVELGRLVPTTPVASPELPMASLRAPAYQLAHATRNLVLTSWKVNLPALQGERSEN